MRLKNLGHPLWRQGWFKLLGSPLLLKNLHIPTVATLAEESDDKITL
jgi:hypothetical protein